jgi:hypothetical protein
VLLSFLIGKFRRTLTIQHDTSSSFLPSSLAELLITFQTEKAESRTGKSRSPSPFERRPASCEVECRDSLPSPMPTTIELTPTQPPALLFANVCPSAPGVDQIRIKPGKLESAGRRSSHLLDRSKPPLPAALPMDDKARLRKLAKTSGEASLPTFTCPSPFALGPSPRSTRLTSLS